MVLFSLVLFCLKKEHNLKKTKIRGEESNGMICSGKELRINDDHEGIMILDTKEKVGTPIENILNLKMAE